MGLLSWLFASRSPKPASSRASIPDIAISASDGFADLALFLSDSQRLADGSHSCVARSLYEGKEVGFRALLPAIWQKGSLGDTGITTYQAPLVLESIGAASDHFVAMLAELYAQSPPRQKMAERATFTAISLEGNPAQLESGPTKIKLFFEPDVDSDEAFEQFYAELYLNIDISSLRVEFHEKDPNHRAAVLHALSGTGNRDGE